MSLTDDIHLDVCESIEIALKREYQQNPHLTDALCILALENAKIAVKQHYGYAKNETLSNHSEIQGIIARCVAIAEARVGKVNDLTLKEFITRIEKIKRSVKRHAEMGSRGYFEFVKDYLR